MTIDRLINALKILQKNEELTISFEIYDDGSGGLVRDHCHVIREFRDLTGLEAILTEVENS